MPILNLTRDLIFFDIESTGLNIMRDRIVQIALIKYKKSDPTNPEDLEMLINPGIPISEESMSIHGITPKDVANKPTFAQVAKQLFDFIGNADLGGYNAARFDIPLLMEEFHRVGLEFDVENRRTLDMQRIFYKMEPRTLRAALRFYCDKDLEDAHDALADVKATVDVFMGQLERYEGQDYIDEEGKVQANPIVNDMQTIHEFTNDLRMVDVTQRLRYDHNGDICINFGKHNGQTLQNVLKREPKYLTWMMESEFSVQVKNAIRKFLKANEK